MLSLLASFPWAYGLLGFSETNTFWLAIGGIFAGGIAVGLEIERLYLGPLHKRLDARANPHAEWKRPSPDSPPFPRAEA